MAARGRSADFFGDMPVRILTLATLASAVLAVGACNKNGTAGHEAAADKG